MIKSLFHKLNLLMLLFCSLNISSCQVIKQDKELEGNVYVFDSVKFDPKFNGSFPIVAIRIDGVENDSIYVKYKVGTETFADMDFIFQDSCNCYLSVSPALLVPFSDKNRYIYLTNIGKKDLVVGSVDGSDSIKEYKYRFSYKMKIDRKTNRDPYYAEDGYKLTE